MMFSVVLDTDCLSVYFTMHHTQVKYWDLWMGLQLLFTALVTPYQVAFLVMRLDGASTPTTEATDTHV
jgi:hypothetical protein